MQTQVGFSQPSRCCAAVYSSAQPSFLVSTTSLGENEIYLIQYDSVTNSAAIKKIYVHPTEIRSLAINISDPSILFTSSIEFEKGGTTQMFKLRDNFPSNKIGDIELKSTIPHEELSEIVLSPFNSHHLCLHSMSGLYLFEENEGEWNKIQHYPSAACKTTLAASWGESGEEMSNNILTSNLNHILITDLREKEFLFASGGKEGDIKLWDLRMPIQIQEDRIDQKEEIKEENEDVLKQIE
ncbi:MAG: hypothetical protein EZS28_038145, partial [Streblomastix strix]